MTTIDSESNVLLGDEGKLDLQRLLELPSAEFIPEAFRCLLGREPDTGGARHYAMRMAKHYNRLLILAELRSSPEGQEYIKFAQSAKLDSLVNRYRTVRSWPLGRWRWLFLPRCDRAVNDSQFDWQRWKFEVVEAPQSFAEDQTSIPHGIETRLSQMERRLESVLSVIEGSLTVLEREGAAKDALAMARNSLSFAQLPATANSDVSWEARAIYNRLLRSCGQKI